MLIIHFKWLSSRDGNEIFGQIFESATMTWFGLARYLNQPTLHGLGWSGIWIRLHDMIWTGQIFELYDLTWFGLVVSLKSPHAHACMGRLIPNELGMEWDRIHYGYQRQILWASRNLNNFPQRGGGGGGSRPKWKCPPNLLFFLNLP